MATSPKTSVLTIPSGIKDSEQWRMSIPDSRLINGAELSASNPSIVIPECAAEII
jgi:hypothetical protein